MDGCRNHESLDRESLASTSRWPGEKKKPARFGRL